MTEIPPEIVENAATDPVQAALQVLDAFISAVNASDAKALFRTLNFPHIRMASERVAIWNNEEEDVESYLKAFAGRAGSDWHHSTFDSKEVLQSSDTKVHVAVRFTRWDGQDNIIATYNSLYIVNCVDGHWGIQARSSFAP